MGLFRFARALVKAFLAPQPPRAPSPQPPTPAADARAQAAAEDIVALLESIRASLAQVETLTEQFGEETEQLFLAAKSLADEAVADVDDPNMSLETLAEKAEKVRVLAEAIRERVLLGGFSRRPGLPN